MDQRAWISCAFFASGIEFIYWNMKWTGSNHHQNPTWVIVSGIHNFVLISICLVVTGFLLPLLMSILGSAKKKMDIKESATPTDSSTVVERTKELEEKIEKQQAEQLKLEEQRKQEIIKRRRERSANAAAHDALDDFL